MKVTSKKIFNKDWNSTEEPKIYLSSKALRTSPWARIKVLSSSNCPKNSIIKSTRLDHLCTNRVSKDSNNRKSHSSKKQWFPVLTQEKLTKRLKRKLLNELSRKTLQKNEIIYPICINLWENKPGSTFLICKNLRTKVNMKHCKKEKQRFT